MEGQEKAAELEAKDEHQLAKILHQEGYVFETLRAGFVSIFISPRIHTQKRTDYRLRLFFTAALTET